MKHLPGIWIDVEFGASCPYPRMERGGDVLVALPKASRQALRTSPPRSGLGSEVAISGYGATVGFMTCRILISSFVLASCLTIHAADWPSWRGPDRNGISKEADWSSAWDVAGPAKA